MHQPLLWPVVGRAKPYGQAALTNLQTHTDYQIFHGRSWTEEKEPLICDLHDISGSTCTFIDKVPSFTNMELERQKAFSHRFSSLTARYFPRNVVTPQQLQEVERTGRLGSESELIRERINHAECTGRRSNMTQQW